jgi:hypothetical protein
MVGESVSSLKLSVKWRGEGEGLKEGGGGIFTLACNGKSSFQGFRVLFVFHVKLESGTILVTEKV